MNTHNHDVVVIGGGQAGLAIGRHLAEQGRDFVILDAATEPAAAWRARWDSLRLFTAARYDALPGRPFPGDPDHYPSRDEVVEYLTAYAQDLPVDLDSRAQRLVPIDGGYRVELEDRAFEADQVVVATGPFQSPRIPALARDLDLSVRSLHSSAYRRPGEIRAGRVLVVGGGNTGYQIAEELASTHEVHLAIGTRQTPMAHPRARRLPRPRRDRRDVQDRGHPRRAPDEGAGHPRRVEPAARPSPGHPLASARHRVRGASVVFEDGAELTVDAVVWATGFATDHSWIEADIFDSAGRVVQQRGVTPAPGLYVLGLPWMHTRGSALLGWVGEDAAYLAQQIAALQANAAGSLRTGSRSPGGVSVLLG